MRLASLIVSATSVIALLAGQADVHPAYKVLPPITEHNLTVFPVTADRAFDTSRFLTLDEGIRDGSVTVTEMGQTRGLVRPMPLPHGGVLQEGPLPVPEYARPVRWPQHARVNSLALINNSDRPLILLAGEIVTGGKQDRVVGKDRIIPAHSEPVSLDVFCVEPHRWEGISLQFDGTASSMAQPSVRLKAMAAQNQEQVWDEVAKSRAAFAGALAAPQALAFQSSSSYAKALQNKGVQLRLDSIAAPIETSYEKLKQQLRAQRAAGAVVAVNGEIIWADVFASPALLEKYWPKLVRSYAAEALAPRVVPTGTDSGASQESAQRFLDHLFGRHESIESEPGVYRNTEVQGDDFKVFLLTSLLPGTEFPVHLAKMQE